MIIPRLLGSFGSPCAFYVKQDGKLLGYVFGNRCVIRELEFLAARRPAIIGNDTWCFEVMDEALTKGAGTPGHQLLSMKYGIRVPGIACRPKSARVRYRRNRYCPQSWRSRCGLY